MSLSASSLSPAGTTRTASLIRPDAALDIAGGAGAPPAPASPDEVKTREVFQQFVAGTFFQQMFKALRKTQGKAHYFHGGQAEEIFQAQFDQQISEELAKRHGAAMCESLAGPFLQHLRARIEKGGASPAGTLNQLV